MSKLAGREGLRGLSDLSSKGGEPGCSPGRRGGRDTPIPGVHTRQQHHHHKNRQSPEGKEREFPPTRVGHNISQVSNSSHGGSAAHPSGNPTPVPQQIPLVTTAVDGGSMGTGDDRFYHQNSSQSSNPGSLRCNSQLGQSRDFHYTLQDHPYGASRPNRQGRQDVYHNPIGSQGNGGGSVGGAGSGGGGGGGGGGNSASGGSSTRARAGSRELYLDSTNGSGKASPYHATTGNTGTLRASAMRQRAAPQEPNYLLLRHQEQMEFDRMQQNSNSRSELLENDHNATMYEMSAPYVALPPRPYEIFRNFDGKFVRTTYINDYDQQYMDQSIYQPPYMSNRPTAHHTLRRPSKSRRSNNPPSDNYGNNCCPREDFPMGSSGRGRNQMGMSTMQQPYATLGRVRTDKRAPCPAQGIGDNYGRNPLVYPDDSRSLASYTDDCLPIAGYHDHNLALHGGSLHPQSAGGQNSRLMSRSTDRNLDSLSDEDLLMQGGIPMRTSEEMLTLLTREPPDGKEKPEPSKTSLLKLEALSRKNSKCDLLDTSIDGGNRPSLSSSTTPMQNPSNNGQTSSSECRSEAASLCGDTASVMSAGSTLTSAAMSGQGHNSISKTDSGMSSGLSSTKRDSLTGSLAMKDNVFLDSHSSSSSSANSAVTTLQQSQLQQDQDLDSGLSSSLPSNKEWKSVTGSPRCSTLNSNVVGVVASSSATSPKASLATPSLVSSRASQIPINPSVGGMVVPQQRSIVSYNPPSAVSIPNALPSHTFSPNTLSTGRLTTAAGWNVALKRSCQYVIVGTAKFFGVDPTSEAMSKMVWVERRRRIAIKKFGGVKDEYAIRDGGGHSTHANPQFGDGCSRFRYDHHLTSELEGDKMVLKITKPPRNKDSLSSMTGQGMSYLINSLMIHKVPIHQIVAEHDISRSYQPSMTGIAAYYQAEQSGGLAVCPPPLPRVPSSHHLHGESPAEEVFFTKPNCDGDDLSFQKRIAYNSDQYRSCSWQLPRPDAPDLPPRMSSDVGASRIWNRLLDAAFDNSDRRKHGMGVVGRVVSSRRRATRRPPESNRKRKLGGNSSDHRPYFTYWMTTVQILVMLISMMVYGVGPVGIDLYKKAGMVLVTNLELEPVDHLEPANFWIGPSATSLIHLGAKYAPCMRWDEVLDRDIKEERLKERDTACCIRKDRAGCVQSPKTECSKVGVGGPNEDLEGGMDGNGGSVGGVPPRSNWWRPSEWYSKYPNENRRSSGPVCGLDPAYCEAPASVAPYIWPDDITKWPICRRKTDVENLDQMGHTAEHMICEIIGHPCCIGIRGQCKITTKEYCMFVGGTFHEEAALCSQVSCLDDVCGLLPFRDRDVPDQFYRTWTPLFLHAGIIHLLITVVLQYWLMRDLEKMAGTARIAIIYLGSGMIGNLASAIFVPYRAEVGPAGAHFGLLACCMVEIIHQWHMLKYPEMAILKLVGVTAVLFLAGLLPWVDNYAHLFGFISGFFLSYALFPFVTFGGSYERKRKLLLVVICLASVVLFFVGLLLLFYITPIHDCEICKYFNCIPITKDFCADQNIDLRSVEI
ncbi:hypothetical protein TCAL_07253 [Tigriopus californicus]|uniref:Peptidase S54 rhomboid domain-containing protein n=2 Tax=Tigriopus californicus TaxID=6832 RepID=A0A553NT06_TIGCA|nr:hypothetical protein TCAL_07253 [Tigriopus californicus]